MPKKPLNLDKRVRNSVKMAKKTSKTVITYSDVHQKKHGHGYGWEIQPSPDPEHWGIRCLVPCYSTKNGSTAGYFGMIAASIPAVINYFDLEYRYNKETEVDPAILSLQRGKPKWLPVKLIARPDSAKGSQDPLEALVAESFQQFRRKNLQPIIRVEQLLQVYAPEGVIRA